MKRIGQIFSEKAVPIIIFLFLLIHSNAFCNQKYLLQGINGTISIPDGFNKAEDETHQKIEDFIALGYENLSEEEKRMYVKRDAIYYKKTSVSYPDYPWFTIQLVSQKKRVTRKGFLNFVKSIEKLKNSNAHKVIDEGTDVFKEIVQSFTISKEPVVNFFNNSIYYEMDINLNPVVYPNKQKCFIHYKVYKFGLIIINYYAKESDYHNDLKTFMDITRSIKIPYKQEIK